MLLTETSVASRLWPAYDWAALASAAVAAAFAETPHGGLAASTAEVETSVRLSDDAEVKTLNGQYRHKEKPTNVLSFPMVQADLLDSLANSGANDLGGEILLGDIILAAETCIREAAEKQWALPDYVQHLIVHGLLHLLGYDHEFGDTQATAMEALESAACRALGLPEPYSG